MFPLLRCCFQYDKDSKMKANHNEIREIRKMKSVVSSTTKIVKWKQITTLASSSYALACCFQYDKDSKMKANHNLLWRGCPPILVVSSTTKIVKWKQITTVIHENFVSLRCFQYDKDSKMKANHNLSWLCNVRPGVVSSTTKIVKWKQITTNSS